MSSANVSYWLSRFQVIPPKQKRCFRYQLHKLIWQAFPGFPHKSNQPFLFTVLEQEEHNMVHCLVQSKTKPDWSAITRQKGDTDQILLNNHEIKQVHFQVSEGDQFFIQLHACPIKNIYKGPSTRGQKVPVYNPVEIEGWFFRQAKQHGFWPLKHEFSREKILVRRESKPHAKDILLSVCKYNGTIEVVNVCDFKQSLISGIGKKKIFGFGMPMLSPAY